MVWVREQRTWSSGEREAGRICEKLEEENLIDIYCMKKIGKNVFKKKIINYKKIIFPHYFDYLLLKILYVFPLSCVLCVLYTLLSENLNFVNSLSFIF